MDRKEADKQLLLPGNSTGTFLVREAGGKTFFVSLVKQIYQVYPVPLIRLPWLILFCYLYHKEHDK